MTIKLGNSFQAQSIADIDDALAALQTLDHNLAASNMALLQNFNRAYLVITQNVRRALKRKAFEHTDFLNKFDSRFVFYFVSALEEYMSERTTPKAWQSAFDAATSGKYSPFVCMALGVNAHVNNDIPQVLRDCQADKVHYKDYLYVNGVIRDSIYEVIDGLDKDTAVLNPKQRLLKPMYRIIMSLMVRAWRYNAWRKYQKLNRRTITIEEIEHSAARLARAIALLPL